MSYSIFNCVDAGSENCPCYLAVTGDCLTCSRLQGKDYCDCSWRGVCIYNEYIQANRRINNPREDFTARIVSRKMYMEDLVVYVLDVGKGFAIKASQPGSYVFLRTPQSSRFYDLPISVMYADIEKGQLHVAIKVISAKTKILLEEKQELILRGVYRNGIQNVAALKRRDIPGGKILLVVKGMGLAPGILAAGVLCRTNQVDFIIDTEKISTELIGDYLSKQAEEFPRSKEESLKKGSNLPGQTTIAPGQGSNLPGQSTIAPRQGSNAGREKMAAPVQVEKDRRYGVGTVKYLSLKDPKDTKELRRILKRESYAVAAVLASDHYIQSVGSMIRKALPDCDLAVSNNFRLCCGEGICGACTVTDESGETIRMCKCQLSGDELWKGGNSDV